MKKKVSLLLMALMLFSFSIVNASGTFKDVKGTEWFYKDVNSLIELGAISGYTDGTFKPNNKVSRAEFIKILITAIGETPGNNTGHWASGYINKAEVLGLIKAGTYQGEEGNKIITRNEIARIVSIADSVIFEGMEGNVESNIKDMDLIPSEYKQHVKNVYSKGIITGFPDGRFGGQEGLSRGEASVAVLRLIRPDNRTNNEEVIVPVPEPIIEEPKIEEPKVEIKEEPVKPVGDSTWIEPKLYVHYWTGDYDYDHFSIFVENHEDYYGGVEHTFTTENISHPNMNRVYAKRIDSETEYMTHIINKVEQQKRSSANNTRVAEIYGLYDVTRSKPVEGVYSMKDGDTLKYKVTVSNGITTKEYIIDAIFRSEVTGRKGSDIK